jgi:hypothetical protein
MRSTRPADSSPDRPARQPSGWRPDPSAGSEAVDELVGASVVVVAAWFSQREAVGDVGPEQVGGGNVAPQLPAIATISVVIRAAWAARSATTRDCACVPIMTSVNAGSRYCKSRRAEPSGEAVPGIVDGAGRVHRCAQVCGEELEIASSSPPSCSDSHVGFGRDRDHRLL